MMMSQRHSQWSTTMTGPYAAAEPGMSDDEAFEDLSELGNACIRETSLSRSLARSSLFHDKLAECAHPLIITVVHPGTWRA
jgi:hypothetical protein